MGLDIRWPIGLMFTLLGALLTGFGALNRAASVTRIDGQEIDINLIWGVVLLVFGILMLVGAVRSKGKNKVGQ
jgi:Na+/H+ antiporter NhaD/arsenite permease-like protein